MKNTFVQGLGTKVKFQYSFYTGIQRITKRTFFGPVLVGDCVSADYWGGHACYYNSISCVLQCYTLLLLVGMIVFFFFFTVC